MPDGTIAIPPPLVPQQERGRATHQRILGAAAQVLTDSGIAGFTTSVVSERSGVSIGALFRHFPTRETLVVATVQHSFAQQRTRFNEAIDGCQAGDAATRVRMFIRTLWSHLRDPEYLACLEVYSAARTNPKLAHALIPIAQEQAATTDAAAAGLLLSVGVPFDAGLVGLGAVVFYALEGIALDEEIVGDPGPELRTEAFHHLERLILDLIPTDPPLPPT